MVNTDFKKPKLVALIFWCINLEKNVVFERSHLNFEKGGIHQGDCVLTIPTRFTGNKTKINNEASQKKKSPIVLSKEIFGFN